MKPPTLFKKMRENRKRIAHARQRAKDLEAFWEGVEREIRTRNRGKNDPR